MRLVHRVRYLNLACPVKMENPRPSLRYRLVGVSSCATSALFIIGHLILRQIGGHEVLAGQSSGLAQTRLPDDLSYCWCNE